MKRFLARVLAVLMAFSLTATAFAAEARYETSQGRAGEGTFVEAVGAVSTGGQVWLQENASLNGEFVEIDLAGGQEVKIDLCGHELTVTGYGDLSISGGSVTIENGAIVVEGDEAFAAVVVGAGDLTITGVDIDATNVTVAPIISTDEAKVTVENCAIEAGSNETPVFMVTDSGYAPSDDYGVTIISGQFVGSISAEEDSPIKLADGSGELKADKAAGVVVTGKDTAAVVVDENGKAKLYGDLAEAVKASGGAKIVVTDEEALADLKVSAGDKLNLVNAAGESLNDKVSLGDNLVMDANGLVSVKPSDPVVGPVTPVTPVTPVSPWDVMDTPVADDPTVEIDDPSVPLAAGPVTRAEFIDYLWRHDGEAQAAASTFADVAEDHEYASAIGWAQANGLILGDENNNFAPDELITVAAVRVILTRYADWKEMAMPELTTLAGADGEAVLNCDEVLAEFFGE